MQITAVSRISAADFDPEEIRRLVGKAKQRGLIRQAGEKSEVSKDGEDLAAGGPFRSVWVDVTPAKAKAWLANNLRNRPVSEDTVKAYARDMLAGVWIATHQGIAFNDRDELIDGQHRLHAVIAAGITVRMMVTFGMPTEIQGSRMTTMDAVDRGRPRSVADQLKIQHGLKHGSAIAMICASIANLCQSERTRRLSVGTTLEIYAEFRSAVDWVIDSKPTKTGIRAKGVLAAAAFAIAADPAVKTIARRIFEGSPDPDPSPVGQLREFLLSEAAILLNRTTDRGLAELTLQAIWLDLRNDHQTILELAPAGLEFFRSANASRVEKIASLFALPGS